MSLAGTLITPRIDSKIRRVSKYNRRPTDFKDILRQRFKSRIKANRRSLFEKMRSINFSETVQDTLSEYLRQEIDGFDEIHDLPVVHEMDMTVLEPELDYDQQLEVMKQIETELLEEEFSWIIEECRKEEEELNYLMMETFTCPICQRGILQKHSNQNFITCTLCSLHLFTFMSLDDLGAALRQNVEEHSRNCTRNPQFSFINDLNTLIMSCDHCSCLITLN